MAKKSQSDSDEEWSLKTEKSQVKKKRKSFQKNSKVGASSSSRSRNSTEAKGPKAKALKRRAAAKTATRKLKASQKPTAISPAQATRKRRRNKTKKASTGSKKAHRSRAVGILGVAYVDSEDDSDWVEGASSEEEDHEYTDRLPSATLKRTPTILLEHLKTKPQTSSKKKEKTKAPRRTASSKKRPLQRLQKKSGHKGCRTSLSKSFTPFLQTFHQLAPFLTLSMKITLCQVSRSWRKLINDVEVWRDTELSANFCVVGRRTSRSGRVSLLTSDALFFLVREVVQQRRFQFIAELDIRGINLGALDDNQYPVLLSTVAQNCKQITALNLCYSYVDYGGWKTGGVVEKTIINLFPDLRKLGIELYEDKWLKRILCSLTKLTSIEFAGHLHSAASYPSHTSFRLFKETPAALNLQNMTLRDLHPSSPCLQQLAAVCPNLRSLKLVKYSNYLQYLKPAAFDVFGKQMPSLQELVIQDQISSEDIANDLAQKLVSKCPNIAQITVLIEMEECNWLHGMSQYSHHGIIFKLADRSDYLPFQALPNQYL